MTPTDKILEMEKIFTTALTLAAKKGRDYSGTIDGLGNFRTFGWKGIVVRLEDKMQRMIQFTRAMTMAVKGESIEDTLIDLINYAALCLIMHREENKKNAAGPASVFATEFPGLSKVWESPIGKCDEKVTIPPLDAKSLRFRNMLDNMVLFTNTNIPTGRVFFRSTLG